jgi:tetratricopeptide (TPR) repeat protein
MEKSVVKPSGTITKYYPFVNEETTYILDSLMEKASSYNDFVQRLTHTALENDVPTDLAYIAAVQAWWCRLEETMKSLQEKYKDVQWIKPWGYSYDSVARDQLRYHDAVVEDTEKAIESSGKDWIETELHLLHALYHFPSGDITSFFEPIEKAKKLIEMNPLLKCFESLICAFEGLAKAGEDDMKEAMSILRRGRDFAEQHDDSLYKYMNMLQMGNVLRCVDAQDASVAFEELYQLAQDLEVPGFICEVLNDSSLLYETTGEYDLAISCHQEIMKVLSNRRLSDTNWIIVARVYATLSDGHQALEWINRGIEDAGPFVGPGMHTVKAWALALLDRIDEAEQALDVAHTLAIKSGRERALGEYYHASGAVELRRGDFPAALDFLEHAWEIAERTPRGTNQNRALLELARAEVMAANQSGDRTKSSLAVPGRWLSRLETHAAERKLPGIKMYAALLKSEFYQYRGQLRDAYATLVNALEITDSLGVKTLRNRISSRIQEIGQLMSEKGMVL